MGKISMTHYQIPNSVLFGRAKGGRNITKALSDYSLETLQKRANNGNADAKKYIAQIQSIRKAGK